MLKFDCWCDDLKGDYKITSGLDYCIKMAKRLFKLVACEALAFRPHAASLGIKCHDALEIQRDTININIHHVTLIVPC